MKSKTIVAIATAPGIGGLSVIRISGESAFDILSKCFLSKRKIDFNIGSRIYYGKIVHNDILIDSVNAAIFKSPKSYTGENTVEISCHGNWLLATRIVDIFVECGAVYAEPGEFTKRAFLNGKLDLTQAEAVADLIHSVSVPGVETAAKQLEGNFTERLKVMRQKLLDISSLLELELDFADEGLDLVPKSNIINQIDEASKFCNQLISSFTASEICRTGYYVGIAGFPNSGKSTLFNSLIGRKRSIVSEIPGTTRDYLEEGIYINGVKIIIADTAGIRDTEDIIEIEGIKLVESVIEKSNMVLILNDSTISINESDKIYNSIKNKYPDKDVILLQNKIDISGYSNDKDILLSAKNGNGIDYLLDLISSKASSSISALSDVMINSRHRQLLINAEKSLKLAKDSLESGLDNELISVDLRNATKILGELTGESWNEEVLANIFSRFCIGK
jgi:tRNA modification GTPase